MFERRGQKRKQAKPAADMGAAGASEASDGIRPAPPGAVPTRQVTPTAPPPRMPAGGNVGDPNTSGQGAPGRALPPSSPPRAAAPVVGQAPMPPQMPTPAARPEGIRRSPDPVQPVAPPPTLTPPQSQAAAPSLSNTPNTGSNNSLDANTGNTAMSSYAPGSTYAPGSATGLSAADSGKLIVGRDIELTGQVKNCELLVVEGVVEATLVDTKALEVTERGIFRGTAPVEKAYVAGLVEGDLIVDGHVMIRSTGVVNGNVKFDEIEIERGGRVRGSMQQITDQDLGADLGTANDDAAGD